MNFTSFCSYYVIYFDENMTGFGGYCDYTEDFDEAKTVADSYYLREGIVCAGVYETEQHRNVYAVGCFR